MSVLIQFWEQIIMDFILGLSFILSGYIIILVFMDKFNRMIYLVCIKEISTVEDVMDFFSEICVSILYVIKISYQRSECLFYILFLESYL